MFEELSTDNNPFTLYGHIVRNIGDFLRVVRSQLICATSIPSLNNIALGYSGLRSMILSYHRTIFFTIHPDTNGPNNVHSIQINSSI